MRRSLAVLAIGTLMLTAQGCRPGGPVPIAYGSAECAYCRMQISDPRYGGEVVMHTGKIRAFDSIDCMAGYLSANPEVAASASLWVTDWSHPGTLIPLSSARFLRADGPAGPMGHGVLALGAASDTAAIRARLGGTWATWREVLADAATSHDPDRSRGEADHDSLR
jgi:copper chaperone NosL